jgi:tetraacyldisaccharide 4'-kinase
LIQFLYSEFVRARRRYYTRRPDLQRHLRVPVVSVGNLTAGGGGKTPVVAALARLLLEMGERPAILSRGYARQEGADGVVVVGDGTAIRSDLAHAGDEPCMLARALAGAAVLVSPSRYLAGRLAETRLGCSVHLLDDGFQHLQLARDVDLLVVPPSDLDDLRTLPFGRLREPIDAAAAADAVFVPVGEGMMPHEVAERLKIARAFAIERMLEAPQLVEPPGAVVQAGPTRVYAVAGIARPERFFRDLERAGWQLTGTRRFWDHHPYSAREAADIAEAAGRSGADLVLTTEKDMVRLAVHRWVGPPLAWVPLRVAIEPACRPWLAERLGRARAGGTV